MLKDESIISGFEMMGELCFSQFYASGICPTKIETLLGRMAYDAYSEYVQKQDQGEKNNETNK